MFIATQLNSTQLNWPSWTAYSQVSRVFVYDVTTYKLSQLFTLSSSVELSCVAINTPLTTFNNNVLLVFNNSMNNLLRTWWIIYTTCSVDRLDNKKSFFGPGNQPTALLELLINSFSVQPEAICDGITPRSRDATPVYGTGSTVVSIHVQFGANKPRLMLCNVVVLTRFCWLSGTYT